MLFLVNPKRVECFREDLWGHTCHRDEYPAWKTVWFGHHGRLSGCGFASLLDELSAVPFLVLSTIRLFFGATLDLIFTIPVLS